MQPANVFATHEKQHADEIGAKVLASEFCNRLGADRFSFPPDGPKHMFFGSDEAAIAFIQSHEGVIAFGIGGGDWDEHKPSGREKRESCILKVATDLGLTDHPAFAELIAEIHRGDTESGQKCYELGEIVKTVNGYSDLNDEDVYFLISPLIIAHVNARAGTHQSELVIPDPLEFIERQDAVVREAYRFHRCPLFEKELKRWRKKPETVKPLELPRLVEDALRSTELGHAKVADIVQAILEARHRRFVKYQAAGPELERAKREGAFHLDTLPNGFRVGVIDSDNPEMGSYMRGREADVLFIRRKTGHFYVSSGRDAKGTSAMDAVARGIVRAEFTRRGELEALPAALEELEAMIEGEVDLTLPGCPEWYYFQTGETLMNGSLTKTEVPASQLVLRDLYICVVRELKRLPTLVRPLRS